MSSSSTKQKGKRSRSKKQHGIDTKKGSKLTAPKSSKSHKKSKSVDYGDTKSAEKSTLKTPIAKHDRSKSTNMTKVKSTKKTKKSKISKDTATGVAPKFVEEERRLVDCWLCRDGSYQQKMKKKNKKWKPFVNGKWKRFLVHFEKQHPKGSLKTSFRVVGFIDDRGYRYEVRNISDGAGKKSMFQMHFANVPSSIITRLESRYRTHCRSKHVKCLKMTLCGCITLQRIVGYKP